MYGQWLDLDPTILSPYFGDIPVTTDFRRVFSELMIRRMGNNKLGSIFPGYTDYTPFGLFQGTDIAPQYIASGHGPELARLPAHPQPVYGESLREHSRALQARERDRQHWIRRLLAALGLS